MRRTLDTAAGVIATVIASAFAVLFVVTASMALSLSNLEQQLLNPEAYKRALVRQHIYPPDPNDGLRKLVPAGHLPDRNSDVWRAFRP